jgi:hypothetical protein
MATVLSGTEVGFKKLKGFAERTTEAPSDEKYSIPIPAAMQRAGGCSRAPISGRELAVRR